MAVKAREGQTKPIACRAKSVALFSQGNWGVGQLELRKQIELYWF